MSKYDVFHPAKIEDVKTECMRLKTAFPQLPPEFIAMLMQRISVKGIPTERITDAIDNLIDNFTYPTPTIADIIGFDKKVKLYSHAEVVADIPKGFDFTCYEMVTINDQKRWIRK